jgi:hypothetical protein
MFQVQVPIVPVAPVAAQVMNPMVVQEITSRDSTLAQLGGLHINQVIDMAEAITGCEARNRYSVHSWSPGQELEGPQIMFIREESDGCERICCKQQRHCSLYVHEGHTATVRMSGGKRPRPFPKS